MTDPSTQLRALFKYKAIRFLFASLLAIFGLALCSVRAGAQELVTGTLSYQALIGSTVGMFPATTDCPAGQFITGIGYKSTMIGDPPRGVPYVLASLQIKAQCSTLNAAAQVVNVAYTSTIAADSGMGTHTENTASCPWGKVLTGWMPFVLDGYLTGVRLVCSAILVNPRNMQVTIDNSDQEYSYSDAGLTATPQRSATRGNSMACGRGEVATGLKAYKNFYLEGVSLGCRSIQYKTAFRGISISKSSITILKNNSPANDVAWNSIKVTLLDNNSNPVSNVYVMFDYTPQITFQGSSRGFAQSCDTGADGSCTVNARSWITGTFSTLIKFGTPARDELGTAIYTFKEGPMSHAQLWAPTTDQVADGLATQVISVRAVDSSNNGVPNATATFSAIPNVRFDNKSVNTASSCTTGSDGWCTVAATSTVPGTYNVGASVAAPPSEGTTFSPAFVRVRFVAPPPSPARSGVRLVTNNAAADGTSADVLEVFARDANDNPVSGAVVSFASAGTDVAFNGGTRGQGGSCTTAANGICQVRATSASGVAGSRSSRVSVMSGGVDTALSGTGISAGGATYGASPVTFAFLVAGPRIKVAVSATNGSGRNTFAYDIEGTQPTTASITVTDVASGESAQLLGSLPPRTLTITQRATTAWPDVPVSASCVDRSAADKTATFGTLTANRLTIPASRAPAGADLLCTFVNTRATVMSGQVFGDTGAGGGVANDGLVNGAEAGIAGVAVNLTDCNGRSLPAASTTTDAAGRWRLVMAVAPAAGRLCVEASRGSNRLPTNGSVGTTALSSTAAVSVAGIAYTYSQAATVDRISFAWAGTSGASLSGLNFGVVPMSTFTGDQQLTGRPGSAVLYPHVFTAGSAGSVSFAVTRSVSTPASSGWTEQVFADPGCTRRLQADAAVLFPGSPPALTVTAGQTVCVLMQQRVPAVAAIGHRNDVEVKATFTLARGTATAYVLSDGTTVAADGLSLVTEVRDASLPDSPFTSSNQARPGDTLEYRVTYSNISQASLRNLEIHDTMPAYTSFVSAFEGTTPASLTACTKVTPASTSAVGCSDAQPAGGHGELTFKFVGNLAPGASGTVLIRVKLD